MSDIENEVQETADGEIKFDPNAEVADGAEGVLYDEPEAAEEEAEEEDGVIVDQLPNDVVRTTRV